MQSCPERSPHKKEGADIEAKGGRSAGMFKVGRGGGTVLSAAIQGDEDCVTLVCSVVTCSIDELRLFMQRPSRLGKQSAHCLPAFAQEQPLHEPVLQREHTVAAIE